VVGSPQTFGKGTIQIVGETGQVLGEDMTVAGGLKLTVGYYYLPNGHSVQFEGVKSDIALQSARPAIGERALRRPLAKPRELDIEVKGVGKWMSDSDFGHLVRHLTARHKARSLVSSLPKKGGEKDEAIRILSDMIRYR
jgi:C-terminal processing protease CtpA/Prc